MNDIYMPPISSRPVSGRYRGRHDRFEIELRVDIDGSRPTGRVSADYTNAPAGRYQGSMRMDAPAVVATATHLVITGTGRFTWRPSRRRIRIEIPLAARLPNALVHHYAPDGRSEATFACALESTALRTVQLEEAVQQGVTKVDAYDTGSLPSTGPRRILTYVEAFAEAGIEMVAHPPALVDVSEAGANASWSDAELHAAMVRHFTRWADRPEWAIWLMHATTHETSALDGRGDGSLRGLMFDQHGAQRQGCAIFYDTMRGTDAASQRNRLYACVHELAHGFNLLHSWQKSIATPPVPSRPEATSWMNYPDRFPGGEKSFWPAFGFEFDDLELAHLRHAFRDDVVMGGAPFLTDAALRAPERVGPPPGEAGGLRLALTMPRTFAYGVPVTADLALSATAREGRRVHTMLGPRTGTADVIIARAGGRARVFEPLLHHCRSGETARLRPGDRPIHDAVLLHYGGGGYPFREPGDYDIQARHTAVDGSFALSNIVRIRIDVPRSAADDAVGRLTYRDDEAGVLLSLMGSDAPELRRGNRALAQIIERWPAHPVAAIARLVRGANAARAFKTVSPERPVHVRRPQFARARALVDPVIDVAQLERAVAAATAGGGGRRALSAALATVGTRPGVDPAVGAFLRTRLGEFATVLPGIAAASPPRAMPRPRRQPDDDDELLLREEEARRKREEELQRRREEEERRRSEEQQRSRTDDPTAE